MYHFYIVKYNPLLKYRNWFKIWNKSHTKYIKIHLDPIENTLYCYFCQSLITTINITSLLQKNDKNLHLTLHTNSQDSILELPNRHRIKMDGVFGVGTMDITTWMDIIAYGSKTRIGLKSNIVDSLTGEPYSCKDIEDNGSSISDISLDEDEGDEDGVLVSKTISSVNNNELDDDNCDEDDDCDDCDDDDDELDEINDMIDDINQVIQDIKEEIPTAGPTAEIDRKTSKSKMITTLDVSNKTLSKSSRSQTARSYQGQRQRQRQRPRPRSYPKTSRILPDVLEYLPSLAPKKLSFCITCMKRLSQIQETLPINLKHNIPLQDSIEFVLIDFGTEGLYEWVYENFTWALKTGYLRYLRTNKLKYWHAPIAKNTSHRYAMGEILVNLDCDNFTGKLGALHVMKIFQKYGKFIMLHQWSGVSKDGTYGRISCHRDTFFQLGGYDENFLPMGYQDHDLMMRFRLFRGSSKLINYQYLSQLKTKHSIFPQLYSRAVLNDKGKSMKNTSYLGKMKWQEMNNINKYKSHENLIKSKHRVNDNISELGIKIY